MQHLRLYRYTRFRGGDQWRGSTEGGKINRKILGHWTDPNVQRHKLYPCKGGNIFLTEQKVWKCFNHFLKEIIK